MGKTNTPDLTLAFETTNLVYGRTNNPYDLERTSGGSSGGAAAIVAAGGSPFDIGTDTGGSIRLPSHFCGVVGLKPTSGRVPRTGHIVDYRGVAQGLTHVGPLARHVEDLALVFGLIAGPDGIDPHVVPAPLGDPWAVKVAGLRIAHFTKLPPLEPTAETASAVEGAVLALEKAGARTSALGEIPDSWRIYETYTKLLFGDGGASVLRLLDQWGTGACPLRERMASAPNLSAGEYTAHCEWIDAWRSRMLTLFANHDAIVCPANSGPAPRHGTFDRASAAYTQVFNLTGWPSTVVRAGTSQEGLPLGVQVVAHPWREDVSLAVARHLEGALGPFAGPSL
jgi:amidase